MKSSVSHGRAPSTARLQVLALIAGLSLPLLGGCPGQLGGGPWPPVVGTGSGGATGTGTGGSGTGTGGASNACDAPTMVFPSCVSASCHLPTGFFPPDLSAANAASRLAGVTAATSAGPCVGKKMIETGDRANSVLLKRVEGTTCGALMPYMMPALSQTQMDCLTNWVTTP